PVSSSPLTSTLSLHAALPISLGLRCVANCDVPDLDLFPHRYPSVESVVFRAGVAQPSSMLAIGLGAWAVRSILLSSLVPFVPRLDRKSTRLNSSHVKISYAVF